MEKNYFDLYYKIFNMDNKTIAIIACSIVLIGICLYIAKNHSTTSEAFGHGGGHGSPGHSGRGRPGWGRRGWLADGGYSGLGYPYFYWNQPFSGPYEDIVYPANYGPLCVNVDKYDQCDILRPNKIAVDTLGSGIRNQWQCCANRQYGL